ncbi:MFS transporter [Rhodovarius crocodyli]|uniref:MFS transporter n=1 Tax=Rhodovarius crocodyli TaxID=1979269 RepID=A0A437MCN1_9PROT|nr:MFS transporter [Rhodovarius crocodyli]RVT95397.1 MFS transporter [Rhodovarius crocodyli]
MLPVWAQLVALTLGHVFSNAVRTIPAIAADVMSLDLGIGTDGLAAITGGYSLAFTLAMVPVGVALDRHGSRMVMLWLLGICAAGLLLAFTARNGAMMLLAQAVLGVGCSGMMMAPITFAARNVPPVSFGMWSGVVQATGNSGMLISASPIAWLVEQAGWRAGYASTGLILAVAILAVALLVREDRPAASGRSLMQDARTVLGFAAAPRLLPLMSLASVSLGAMLCLRGLWGGPWLMEVKGLTRLETGNMLLAAATAMVIGPFIAGMVDRALGRPRLELVVAHIVAIGSLLGLLALSGTASPCWDAVMLVGFGLALTYHILLFALVRARVTPDVAGRALSAMNLYFFGGTAAMQALSGLAAAWGGIAGALWCIVVLLALGTAVFAWGEARQRS